ncbi:aspartic peptidase domain-containing protein [Zychaea mexicana]|uniref:aspartic peptidase domain-containing protein n=1 Tax=Zychaea mexicana TaxID=64656 RepID=UPI0022FE248E|nr:aspartic peptidase domain-containing protein [Zychaea mexicana]KAI9499514.1 aspartic peptidase domain-containing protein [Zychaea mexicana]
MTNMDCAADVALLQKTRGRYKEGRSPENLAPQVQAFTVDPILRRGNDDKMVIVVPMGYRDGLLTNFIEVGEPPELFEVTLDTGNGLAWVPSTKCTSQNCEGQKLYDPSESETALALNHKPLELKYEDGKCATVDLYSESIGLYNDNMDAFTDLSLGAGYKIEGYDDVDGYLGTLGFGGPGGLNVTNYLRKRALDQLFRRGLAKRSIVSQVGGNAGQMGVRTGNQGRYHPDTKKKRDNDEYAAYCIIGGIDPNLIEGDPVYVPLPSAEECGEERFWKLSFDSVTFGNTHIDISEGSYAQFYSSSRYIHAPKQSSKALHEQIGATFNTDSGFYELPCASMQDVPDLQFTFGSQNTASLKPIDWIFPISEGSETCRSFVKHVTVDTNNWLLGTAFTNPYYMVYDYTNEQIGFAHNKGEEVTATFS